MRQLNEALGQLAAMFIQMNQNVVEQEVITQQLEEKTYEVKEHQEKANQELDAGIVHKKRANKNKRWCLLIARKFTKSVPSLVLNMLSQSSSLSSSLLSWSFY